MNYLEMFLESVINKNLKRKMKIGMVGSTIPSIYATGRTFLNYKSEKKEALRKCNRIKDENMKKECLNNVNKKFNKKELAKNVAVNASIGGIVGAGLGVEFDNEMRKTKLEELSNIIEPHKELKKQDIEMNPTESQKEAGNYSKGHIKINGMDISIENPKGSYRQGTNKSGKKWKTKMYYDYGYIKGTVGPDKDHVDVFLNSSIREEDPVFVVNQVRPDSKRFDEPKCMIGFNSENEAKKAYLSNYEDGWKGIGNIVELPIDKFKEWVYSDEPKKGPMRIEKEI